MIQAQHLQPGDLLEGAPVVALHHLKGNRVRVETEAKVYVFVAEELVDAVMVEEVA